MKTGFLEWEKLRRLAWIGVPVERLEPRAETLGEHSPLILDELEQECAFLAVGGLELVVENHRHGEEYDDERDELRAERPPEVL